MKPYILIVEDEEPISMMIQYNLEKSDFDSVIACDGDEALICIDERKPDLILMDWMIPVLNGVEICKILRRDDATKNIPIIMLSAKGEEEDKLTGLNSGADDYIVKPFLPRELIARINAVLRRTRPIFNEQMVEYRNLQLNLNNHKVTHKDKTLNLGPTEFKILLALMEKPNKVFSRENLLDSIWGIDSEIEIRTIDVHIRRIRQVLEDNAPELASLIKTVRGVGYMVE